MKLQLDRSWIYAGKHYGPGEVTFEGDDEDAGKAIKAKMDAEAKAAQAEQAAAAESEDEGGNTRVSSAPPKAKNG